MLPETRTLAYPAYVLTAEAPYSGLLVTIEYSNHNRAVHYHVHSYLPDRAGFEVFTRTISDLALNGRNVLYTDFDLFRTAYAEQFLAPVLTP